MMKNFRITVSILIASCFAFAVVEQNPMVFKNTVSISSGSGPVKLSGGLIISGAINLSGAEVTSILPYANGGTGLSSIGSSGQVLTTSGSTALAWLTIPTSSTAVTSVSGSYPIFSTSGTTPVLSLSGAVPIGKGGTNSIAALNNNRIVVASGSAIIEGPALTDGKLLIGSSSSFPVAAGITAGSNVTVTNGSGSITIAANTAGTVTSVSGSYPINSTSGATPVLSLSGAVAVANGGTNSTAALNNNRMIGSFGGVIKETGPLTNGQLFIGATSSSPAAAALTAGTGITITNASGAITVAAANAYVTSVSGSYPINSTSGATPVLSLSGAVAIANGGTNSTVALSNNRMILSSGSTIREGPALTDGKIFIGSSSALPVAANITAGSNITVTNGSGSITIASSAGGGGSGTVTSVSGSYPINSTSGATPVLSLSGAVPIANGGTNNVALSVVSGGILYTDNSKIINTGSGTSGAVLTSQGTNAPIWSRTAHLVNTTFSIAQTASHTGGMSADLTGTYTVPATAPLYIVVEMAGGGGGGAGNVAGGNNGADTTFGSWTAGQGVGGSGAGGGAQGGAGGGNTTSTGTIIQNFSGGSGTAGNNLVNAAGGTGGSNPFGGASGGSSALTNASNAIATTGGGGGGAGSAAGASNPGGGAGGYLKFKLTPLPGDTFSYTVGVGGNGGGGGGGNGGSGQITIQEFYQ